MRVKRVKKGRWAGEMSRGEDLVSEQHSGRKWEFWKWHGEPGPWGLSKNVPDLKEKS